MSLDTTARSTAKHSLITSALIDEIERGRHKVGSLLPSEPELAKLFGVSRQTVRVALRNLRELGLVTPQQGVGSTVRTNKVQLKYSQSFESVDDLLQYATKTRQEVIAAREINIDATLSDWLECKVGERWWCLEMLRTSGTGRKPIAYVKIYVPYAFGPVIQEVQKSGGPIYPRQEELFNEVVTEIRQDITAVIMTAAEARALKTTPRQAALLIVRHYYGKQGNVIQVSRSIHPADSFNYTMRVRLSPNS